MAIDHSPEEFDADVRTKTESAMQADGAKAAGNTFGSYLRKIENTNTTEKRDAVADNLQIPPGSKIDKTNSGNIMDLAIENKRTKKNM